MEPALITLGQIRLCVKSFSHWMPNPETETVTELGNCAKLYPLYRIFKNSINKINELFMRKFG